MCTVNQAIGEFWRLKILKVVSFYFSDFREINTDVKLKDVDIDATHLLFCIDKKNLWFAHH